MKSSIFPAILVLALVSTTGPAFTKNPPANKDQASTARQDTKFLEKADQGNVDEIELAQFALKKSNSDDVKNFAERMIHDHNMLMDNMKPFANEAGIQPPSQPSAATQAEMKKLEALSGVEGYTESIASGMLAGIYAASLANGQAPTPAPRQTANGSLIHYITHSETKKFQPANITFDLLPPLEEDLRRRIRDKKERHRIQCERAFSAWDQWLNALPEVSDNLRALSARLS